MSEPGWLHVLLVSLLSCSAFLSASEAALFGLTPLERRTASSRTLDLLQDPRPLLATLLLANLVVNTLYFAFASRIWPGLEGWQGLLFGLALLVVLLVFGEILPKILALRGRRTLTRLVAPLLRWLVFLLAPLTRPLLAVLERVHRWLAGWIRPEGGITSEVLARVLQRGAAEGALHEGEVDLLTGILELEDIRVREIMTPRVDSLFLDASGAERETVVQAALARRQAWLPLIDGEPDRVLGLVRLREVLRQPEQPLRGLARPMTFVPEVASALDLVRALRQAGAEEAVVVDEYGGTAGVVTLEDAFEQILGDLGRDGEARGAGVEPLGGDRFRVAGDLPIREWNEAFGLEVVPREFETVGGFVTALLGRIPRPGDRLRVGDLELVVGEVRRRRVVTVELGLCAPAAPGGGAAS
ncbi:MAG TPA: CNNM domain-containing protein [Planctomycetota bacterium]